MKRVLDKARSSATSSAKKFTNVSVDRGKTAYPKAPKEWENLGLRWDYDGQVDQIQPNAGKVPSAIREWRENNGGTHAVLGVMYVNKGGSDGTGDGGSGSSEWAWWSVKGMGHRQIGGVDECKSDADSDWIYSNTRRKYFIKYANGAVVWQ